VTDFDFIALDVETANENYWSICQVGLAFFKGNGIVKTWSTLVNPETYFDEFNTFIHGITERDVRKAPKLVEMISTTKPILEGAIVVHHMPFDRVAFSRLAEHLGTDRIPCTWLDTARIARRTWEAVKQKGYGLSPLSEYLQIENPMHHNAENDAIVAGKILLKAIAESKISLEDWVDNSKSDFRLWGSNENKLKDLARTDPNPNGMLFGEVIVFTGALSITRLEAAQMAYKLGCNIDERVTQSTSLLVVGGQDSRHLAGYTKSSKHRKAEEYISKGQTIRIIGEDDFMAMINF
jgi:DNA polymerase III subunit epsilon